MEKTVKPQMISVAKLLEASWADYVAKFKDFMLIYWQSAKNLTLLAGVLSVLLILSLLAGFLPDPSMTIIRLTVLALAFLLAIGGFIYLAIRIQIASLLACAGNQVDSAKTFRESKKFFWKFLGLAFLTAVVVMLWFCLLIIPGIIFSYIYIFAPCALLFEGYEGWAALKRSQELIKGYWWETVWRLLAIGLLWYGVSLPGMFFGNNLIAAAAYSIIVAIAGLFAVPLFLIYQYKIYENLKTIKGESKIFKKTDVSVK